MTFHVWFGIALIIVSILLVILSIFTEWYIAVCGAGMFIPGFMLLLGYDFDK